MCGRPFAGCALMATDALSVTIVSAAVIHFFIAFSNRPMRLGAVVARLQVWQRDCDWSPPVVGRFQGEIMRNRSKSAVFLAATGSLALLLSTSAFADSRHRDETWRGARQQQSDRHSHRGPDA